MQKGHRVLTSIHSNEGEDVLGLGFPVQRSQQGYLPSRSVDAEQVSITLLEEVADLAVEGWSVSVISAHSEHVTTWRGYHVLHDIRDVRRVQERRRVVVDVYNGYGDVGGVVSYRILGVAGAVFRTHCEHVATLALEVEVLGHPDNPTVFTDAEVSVVVPGHYSVPDTPVQALIHVSGGHLKKPI